MNTCELEIKKLSDRIYRLQEDSDMINVDSYLICGDEKAVVIDGLQVCEPLLIAHAFPHCIYIGLKLLSGIKQFR